MSIKKNCFTLHKNKCIILFKHLYNYIITNSFILLIMKILKLFGLCSVLCGLFLFAACENTDLGTTKVTVEGIEIVIPDIIVPEVPEALKSTFEDDGYTPFASTVPVVVRITDGMFGPLQGYLDMLKAVTVNSVDISAAFLDADGNPGKVRNLKIESKAMGSHLISSYTADGTPHFSPELTAYIQKAFAKLMANEEVDFAVSGETNAPANTNMSYKIIVNSVFEVSVKI